MIVVTGGAGFIGSNLVRALNAKGYGDVLVVDDLTDGRKFRNLVDCRIVDYVDKDDFLARLRSGNLPASIEAILHQGACSDTREWDGRYMLATNYDYSKAVLGYCLEHAIPLLYASSAAVYGAGSVFRESPEHEQPLTVYGYSKLLFDEHVRRVLPRASSQVAGLRYFNVYGPREHHKGRMASVVYHLNEQVRDTGTARLFEGSDGHGDGEQRRDFIHVDDIVSVNLWFLDHRQQSGIFNLGTGRARSFNDLARAVLNWHERDDIEYIPFPEELRGRYQSFTEADISALRGAGYEDPFMPLEEGVPAYLEWLQAADGRAGQSLAEGSPESRPVRPLF